jgi:hypothetical protein
MPGVSLVMSSRFCNGDQTALIFPNYSDAEIPSGTIDSVNVTFTLINAPNPVSSMQMFYNGILQPCTVNGTSVTMPIAPDPGDSLVAYYRY